MEYTIKFRAESELSIKVNADSIEQAQELAVRKANNMVTYDHKLKTLDNGSELSFLQPLFYYCIEE